MVKRGFTADRGGDSHGTSRAAEPAISPEMRRRGRAERPDADVCCVSTIDLRPDFIEKTRALRAEGTLQTERARAEAALAAVHEARQQTAAALAELELERRDVAVLRTALDEATAAAGTGTVSTAAPGWDGAAQVAVAETLGAITDMRVALMEIVGVLGTRGGWDAVVAWCPEERRPTMGCVGMWTGGAADLRGLETKTWQARRNPAAGEFGAAWTHNGATCMPDLGTADDRLLRDAAAAGMNAAVFIPIQAGQEKVGALEFWSRRSTPPNADVILFLEAIGLQLGSHAELISHAASPRWPVGRY